MDDYAVVLNAGSSSLKFCVYRRPERDAWRLEARGQIEGIGTSPRFSAKDGAGATLDDARSWTRRVRDGRAALDALAAWLRSRYGGARVLGVGHRVVHGGAKFAEPTVITPQVLEESADPDPARPAPSAIQPGGDRRGVRAAARRAAGGLLRHELPPRRSRQSRKSIPLPRELCRGGVQRYGFHGLSYEYIASVLPTVAPEIASGRVIVAHLGSGASLCALKNGRSVDHSLGFTALDGLCMGTRPGALDPGVVLYLFQSLGLSAKDVETILYKKSGLLGISGISNDMRDLLGNNEPAARLAVDYFVYRAAKEIGALAAVLGGIDGLVFTAGIGENSAEIRSRICEACTWLGVELDRQANERKGPRISRPESSVSAWVIPTNEELMIARHTGSLLGLIEARV